MDGFAFIQIDRERALLIDHIGACERIVKTPLPRAYSINIRRFIVFFLLTLPFSLLHLLDNDWLVPFITMLVAAPLLALDQIGVELQNPFSTSNLSHLPLDDISAGIERNLLAALQMKQADAIAAVRNTGLPRFSGHRWLVERPANRASQNATRNQFKAGATLADSVGKF